MAGILDGRVAVVTGSGQGVGRGIARLLAREGAAVVTNNRRPKSREAARSTFRAAGGGEASPTFTAEEEARFRELSGDAGSTADEITEEGGRAVPFYGDVTDPSAAQGLVDTALSEFGRLDILVNNAAGLGFGPFGGLTEEDWRHQIDAKLNGAFHLMKRALPPMIEHGYGRILNTASDAWTGIAALSAYSTANAGLVALTKATAKELYRFGITVNAFCPQAESPGHVGFQATLRDMLQSQGVAVSDEERMRESEEAHGPAENLTFLAYLASELGADVSGSVFSVTGGGSIALYSEPRHERTISKAGSAWTIDELTRAVPERLLDGYSSPARTSEF